MSGDEHRHDEHRHQHISVGSGAESVSAELITAVHRQGTAHIVVHAHAGHLDPGRRRDLIDALLDSPEARGSDRLAATVPLGDSESLMALTRRCENVTVHAAGASALVEGRLIAASAR